jgi:hypothetical protein
MTDHWGDGGKRKMANSSSFDNCTPRFAFVLLAAAEGSVFDIVAGV